MRRSKLEALCKQKGTTITALEGKCHLGHGTLAKINDPKESTIRLIAKHLEIPICELIGDEDG